ncbi:MAG TPA: hypothetical protein V6C86_05715 [Oculatellaceae cyanobacterium]
MSDTTTETQDEEVLSDICTNCASKICSECGVELTDDCADDEDDTAFYQCRINKHSRILWALKQKFHEMSMDLDPSLDQVKNETFERYFYLNRMLNDVIAELSGLHHLAVSTASEGTLDY